MSGLREALSLARSFLITAPLIILYTAIMGSLSVASSLVDSSGRMQHGCARFWSRLILWTAPVRLRVTGQENIRHGVSYVFCVNHQSHMDIPIVLVSLPVQFRFLSKKELFRIPFLGWHLRRSGQIAIDRENPRAAVKSIRAAAAQIRGGTPVVIFPEGGTRSDAFVHAFKGGGFMLATQSEVDVIPVTIRGSRWILPNGSNRVRGGAVDVIIGAPIASHGLSYDELAARTHERMQATFERFDDR